MDGALTDALSILQFLQYGISGYPSKIVKKISIKVLVKKLSEVFVAKQQFLKYFFQGFIDSASVNEGDSYNFT